jgi:hypothetical protein
MKFEVLPDLAWPLPSFTLHWAYLAAGLLIASHYVPLLKRAWFHPAATAIAQPLSTWAVWTVCRLVAFTYGMFILHDLVFLIVTGADVLGRLAMAILIVRAHRLERPCADFAPGHGGRNEAA